MYLIYVGSKFKLCDWRRDLIPSLYLQLGEKYQKGISSSVTFMEKRKLFVYVIAVWKNIFHLNMVEYEARDVLHF